MQHRTWLKWLHWLSVSLIAWFFFVEPEGSRSDPGGALSVHAGMGLILSLITAAWAFTYLRRGLAGRAGPKLSNWGKKLHRSHHLALQCGLPIMVASGAFAGLAAPFLIRAFGLLPINMATGKKSLHELAEEVHDIAFNALLFVIFLHIVFHVWRHIKLKDNALKIMAPKALHKWL